MPDSGTEPTIITSQRNPRVSALRRLHRARIRRERGQTLLEGPGVIAEALTQSVVVLELYATEDDQISPDLAARAGIEVTLVSDQVLRVIADSLNPRGPVGVIQVPAPAPLRAVDTVVLWEISDPGNAGTIIRTAAAFDFHVAATAGCVDIWAPKVIRAAAGGHFRTALTTALEPETSRIAGAGLTPIVATATGGDSGIHELEGNPEPVALIIGNEAHGVPESVLADPAIRTATLPMPGGTESLNAAVAAGILLYLRRAGRRRS